MSRTTYRDTPKAGLYTRLSVDDGYVDRESNSITSQKQMLTQFAEYHGIEIVETYVDDGWSGTNFERPDFKRMIADIESRKINTVITKDLSRLGRDYLQTGYYTDMYFPSKRVRYIAISDGIDTSTGYNEMAPFKNLFNDFYARDISKKIRSTLTTKARAGIYHSTVPPFGYRKSPTDSHMLLRDEETAPYVIKMFELSASGRGPAAIANYLRAKKVPIPAYWHHVRGERAWQGYKGENDASNYRWFDTTVRSILQHEVYIGNLVAQRQTHIFKVGKSFVRPKEEWVIVEDVFEPLVERELWERVQESFSNPTRARKKTGLASIFSGIVFCDTCNRRISFVPERAEKIYVGSCMEYRKIGRQGCTPHRIYEKDLYDAVLKDIREWAKLALEDEQAVLEKVMEHENRNEPDAGAAIEKRLSLEKRLGEVEKVIAKLYEDYALGKAGADEIDLLLPKYRKEQGELKAQLALFQEESNEQRETTQNAEKWVALIRQYSDLQKLTAGIIRELITKIYVGDVRKVDGEKVQSIEIHYRFIGSLPDGARK
ncbi:MAG: recombinase family protein [Lachnospiraceae bacterium]